MFLYQLFCVTILVLFFILRVKCSKRLFFYIHDVSTVWPILIVHSLLYLFLLNLSHISSLPCSNCGFNMFLLSILFLGYVFYICLIWYVEFSLMLFDPVIFLVNHFLIPNLYSACGSFFFSFFFLSLPSSSSSLRGW